MRILVVNSNTTAAMTERIGRSAREAASPGTEIIATNPREGPVSVEGHYDAAFAVPGMLRVIRSHPDADGVVIACADDPGLYAAREIARCPVIGHTEAATAFAARIAYRFAIVTTLSRSVPVFHELLDRYGLVRQCCSVRGSDVPVLDLERPESGARGRVLAEAREAVERDGAEAIVLGCAGMTDLARWMAGELGVPVIDGVAAGVRMAEALHALGLTTSKRGAFADPGPKIYHGLYDVDAPATRPVT